LEVPVGLEWDYFNRGPNRLTDTITVLNFEVITGTVVAFGMELSASYAQEGTGPVLDTKLGLLKPAVSPTREWWFTYGANNLQQVGFHAHHDLLGYWYPQANTAVTGFENNILFPRLGVDVHRQEGSGDVWTVFRANESGSIRLYINLDASFQSSAKTQRYRGIIYTVWLVYTGDLFYQVPGQNDCVGNNCQRPTPTPSPTPTATPALGSCSNPDLGNDVEVIPVPRIGTGLCAGVGPIDVTLPVVGDISVPQIRVCFVPIWFGTIDLFGVKVNLDLVFAAAAGAMLLRWFWRS
jgi:hypothetical protein